jgi:hypothetical protein
MAATARRGAAAPEARTTPSFDHWSKEFLGELAITSNVSAAARVAGVSTRAVYEARRANAQFNRAWQEALCDGYDNLELDLLRRLREGELKPRAGARKGTRSFDNATAFRLLVAHRDSVARERALREDQDADAIIASINAKLELMRERSLAQRGEADIHDE